MDGTVNRYDLIYSAVLLSKTNRAARRRPLITMLSARTAAIKIPRPKISDDDDEDLRLSKSMGDYYRFISSPRR